MAKYRKKPVVIEAIQFAHPGNDYDVLPDWWSVACNRGAHVGGITTSPTGQILIFTLEGVMRANPGDWIIRGVKGELYPCKPDIFAATYEREENFSEAGTEIERLRAALQKTLTILEAIQAMERQPGEELGNSIIMQVRTHDLNAIAATKGE